MHPSVLFALVPAFISITNAAAIERRASDYVGGSISDVYPPASTTVDTSLFPPESVVGYPGPTPTGVEPMAIQTSPIYPDIAEDAFLFPLMIPDAKDGDDDFDINKYWGNLSPWFSVDSSTYGLNGSSPLLPDQCSITQVHLLYRHGARYPTSGSLPSDFAAKLNEAPASYNFTGELSFLNTWSYKLGAELLSPFGRTQNFLHGAAFRQLYGGLLNNFTEQGAIPVFRTESQDRMVKTAHNFAAGFFGVPEYLDQVNIEILAETANASNPGAPYDVCVNADKSQGSLGSKAATAFAYDVFNSTAARFNKLVEGNLTFDALDVVSMVQLCAYETDNLGYSAFCPVLTKKDFENYEYYMDISFYYNNGPGSPVAAIQGAGYLEEFLARFTYNRSAVETGAYGVNASFDADARTFPLNQSIYADATHEVVILDTLTALNLTGLFQGPALAVDKVTKDNTFKASQVVPFGSHLVVQVLECADRTPTKQIRFIVNDAVVPIAESHHCPEDADGLCAFDTVVESLQNRLAEIDYDWGCNGDWNATVSGDVNGLPPKKSS